MIYKFFRQLCSKLNIMTVKIKSLAGILSTSAMFVSIILLPNAYAETYDVDIDGTLHVIQYEGDGITITDIDPDPLFENMGINLTASGSATLQLTIPNFILSHVYNDPASSFLIHPNHDWQKTLDFEKTTADSGVTLGIDVNQDIVSLIIMKQLNFDRGSVESSSSTQSETPRTDDAETSSTPTDPVADTPDTSTDTDTAPGTDTADSVADTPDIDPGTATDTPGTDTADSVADTPDIDPGTATDPMVDTPDTDPADPVSDTMPSDMCGEGTILRDGLCVPLCDEGLVFENGSCMVPQTMDANDSVMPDDPAPEDPTPEDPVIDTLAPELPTADDIPAGDVPVEPTAPTNLTRDFLYGAVAAFLAAFIVSVFLLLMSRASRSKKKN